MRGLVRTLVFTFLIVSTVSAQQLPTGGWSGVVYSDYSYNIARDSGFSALTNTAIGGQKDFHAFAFRRIYVTYDADLSSRFSARIRLEADESARTSNGRITTFMKDAFLRWKNAFAGSDVMVGIQPTPAFEVSESFWGYRSLEKTILDLRGIVSSRDQGISLSGPILRDGTVKYKAMFANGSGVNPESDRLKRFYAHAEVKPFENASATVYADLSARPRISSPQGLIGNNATTVAAFVGYRSKRAFAAGVEGFLQSLDHGYFLSGSYLTRTTFGLSAFGNYAAGEEYSVVGRVDLFDTNTHSTATGDSRTYFLLALDWRPEPSVSIIPNLLIETYESASGVAIDPSATGRVTFVYSF